VDDFAADHAFNVYLDITSTAYSDEGLYECSNQHSGGPPYYGFELVIAGISIECYNS